MCQKRPSMCRFCIYPLIPTATSQKEMEHHVAEMKGRYLLAKAVDDKALLLQHGLEYKYYKALGEWLQV